jgi:hypothetical protein
MARPMSNTFCSVLISPSICEISLPLSSRNRRGTNAFDTLNYRTDSSRPAGQSTERSAAFVRLWFHATDEKARTRAPLKTRITRGDHWPSQKAEDQMVRNITRKPTDRSVTAGSLRLSLHICMRRASDRRLSALWPA